MPIQTALKLASPDIPVRFSLDFPRGGARPPTAVLVKFIEAHKERFGVAPICRVLTEHGIKIAPSTYYDAKSRPPSKRALRDDELKIEIARVHRENYGVYGPRKVWLQLNREGIEVARCTVERLMQTLGLQGIRRGKKWKTTTPDPAAQRPVDLVKRRFNPLNTLALTYGDRLRIR